MPDDAAQSAELPPRDHNNPPDDKKILAEKLDAASEKLRSRLTEIKKAEVRLPEKIEDDDAAEGITKFIKQCAQLRAAFEDMRKAEKKPYDDLAKQVHEFFKGLQEQVDKTKKQANDLLTAYQVEKAEEARKKAEAERQAREEAAKEADPAMQGPAPEPEPEPETKSAPVRDLETGTTASLRTVWDFEIEDRAALIKAIAAGEQPLDFFTPNEAKIREAVRKFEIREIPGVRIFETHQSVVR